MLDEVEVERDEVVIVDQVHIDDETDEHCVIMVAQLLLAEVDDDELENLHLVVFVVVENERDEQLYLGIQLNVDIIQSDDVNILVVITLYTVLQVVEH